MPAWLQAPEGSLFLSEFCLSTYHLRSFIRNFYYHVFFFYNIINSTLLDPSKLKHALNYPLRQPREQGGQITVSLWCNISATFYPSLSLVEIMGPCTYLLSPLLDPLWSQNHPGRNSSDLTDKEGLISPMISSRESERLLLWDHLTEALTIDTLCSLPGPFTPLVMWFPESQMFAALEATSPQIPSPSPPTSKYLDDWGHSLWLSYPSMISCGPFQWVPGQLWQLT